MNDGGRRCGGCTVVAGGVTLLGRSLEVVLLRVSGLSFFGFQVSGFGFRVSVFQVSFFLVSGFGF